MRKTDFYKYLIRNKIVKKITPRVRRQVQDFYCTYQAAYYYNDLHLFHFGRNVTFARSYTSAILTIYFKSKSTLGPYLVDTNEIIRELAQQKYSEYE